MVPDGFGCVLSKRILRAHVGQILSVEIINYFSTASEIIGEKEVNRQQETEKHQTACGEDDIHLYDKI
jgi:hypothetical protein